MEITLTAAARQFFRQEMLLKEGDAVRFTSKVYGKTQVHEGFSVAISVEEPGKVIAAYEADGILYYIDDTDEWFFHGYNFAVDFNESDEAFVYYFTADEEKIGK